MVEQYGKQKSNLMGTREKETKKTRKTPVPKKFDFQCSFKSSNKNLSHNRFTTDSQHTTYTLCQFSRERTNT